MSYPAVATVVTPHWSHGPVAILEANLGFFQAYHTARWGVVPPGPPSAPFFASFARLLAHHMCVAT